MAKRGLHVKKGDIFGSWIALEDDECINERRYVECRCECGTIKKIRVDGLLKGTSISCGCKVSPKIEDLIGKKYGNLTIIGSAPYSSRKSILCKCDCGNIVSKHQSLVLNGTRTSCGKCDYVQVKIGDTFGRWIVIGIAEKDKNSYHKKWKCQCSCENHTILDVDEQNLKRGLSLSCGCLIAEMASKNNTIHGETHTRLHNIWCSMRERCVNPNCKAYKDYGGRGITICKEWEEYIPFRDWALSHGYKENLSIDRIDVNGNYEPSNCRWATAKEQCNNKRNTIRIPYKNEKYTASDLSQMFNIKPNEIRRLYKKGLSMEEILIKKGVIA